MDVVIIGAGASGLMCGIEAGKRNCSVLIIDHVRQPGEKIRISGADTATLPISIYIMKIIILPTLISANQPLPVILIQFYLYAQ